MMAEKQQAVELDLLLSLFYDDSTELAGFEPRSADTCPQEYRDLLAHHAHMTVTVERRHGCEVDVEVVRCRTEGEHYLREILLRRKSDRRVVQYGIVRLALATLQPVVRDEILSGKIPLGRVLINHNVLRDVELQGLWQATTGPALATLMGVETGSVTFGRTALIYCNGQPGIELLEIVAPEESFDA